MTRAQPRTADERRREIIAATVPLLEAEGLSVSTRQIADAAGIAEGTIFRVFSTKAELLGAVIESYMDASDLVAQIEEISPESPLSDKIAAIAAIVQQSATRIGLVMTTLRPWGLAAMRQQVRERHRWLTTERNGDIKPGQGRTPDQGWTPVPGHPANHFPPPLAAHAQAFHSAIVQTLAPNRADLAVDPETAATHLLTVCIASVMMATAFPATTPALVVPLIQRALSKNQENIL